MRKAAHVLLGLLLAVVPGTAQTGAHFYSPETNLEQSELAQLETVAPLRGCGDVQLYGPLPCRGAGGRCPEGCPDSCLPGPGTVQQEAQRGGPTTTAILLAAGVEVRVKGARDLMHLKSYAIDGRLLRSGSANRSPTGLKRQDNDLFYELIPEAVEGFERKFEEMWGRASNTNATLAER